jgi:CTP synthase (UTP-ammonia lyase)
VGEYSASFPPHVKTAEAFRHAEASLGIKVEPQWIPTLDLELNAEKLSQYRAVLVAPGAPYESMRGALNAMQYCRETGLTLLGTCGGCQHIAIEFAHNVLGISDAGARRVRSICVEAHHHSALVFVEGVDDGGPY